MEPQDQSVAYSTVCPGDPPILETPDTGKVEVARGLKWKEFKWSEETIHTLRAKDPNCVMQLYANRLDVSKITIWEGFEDEEASKVLLYDDDDYYSVFVRLKSLKYVVHVTSCRSGLGLARSSLVPPGLSQGLTQEGSSVL